MRQEMNLSSRTVAPGREPGGKGDCGQIRMEEDQSGEHWGRTGPGSWFREQHKATPRRGWVFALCASGSAECASKWQMMIR